MENYNIIKIIGEGSFGRVHQAQRVDNGLIVALKKVPKLGRSEKEIRGLRHECEIQKDLKHPNIIHMLDSFETQDSLIIVTEYAAKGELSKLLVGRQQGLAVQQVKCIACDLLSALNYLHGRRILHRDLKPQNILIGADDLYKLCDFGFAKTMGIGTYMLTSVKGTPLYMAPEIIEEKPYDQKAEFWSLGCILYELLVGRPPYFTTSLFQLVKMIRTESILFPEFLTGSCRSFLQGLLEKSPKKRFEWHDILMHPFIKDDLRLPHTGEHSLTKALSPSQELVKENQRQNLQRKVAGYSRLLIKTAKKFEEAQKELKKCGNDGKSQIVRTPVPSPNAIPNDTFLTTTKRNKASPSGDSTQTNKQKAGSDAGIHKNVANDITALIKNLKVDTGFGAHEYTENNSGSSCETLTSSSDGDLDSGDESEDGRTVIIGNAKGRRKGSGNKQDLCRQPTSIKEEAQTDESKSVGGAECDSLWNIPTILTLHQTGLEDKHIQSEEWSYFLIKTMKEVVENPRCVCEKHFLTFILGPLRNHLAGPEVVEKIADLLCVPYTMEVDQSVGFMTGLQSIYLDSKVLPHILYSCKLTVRRRLLERGSVELEEMIEILTFEDLAALNKCLRLVCFLVYMEEDFVVQFCDSYCFLKLLSILHLFLKLDKRDVTFASDTLAILCQLMRIIPSNVSIVEELFVVTGKRSTGKSHDEFWRLLQHENPRVKSRATRILSYLAIHSAKTRENFIKSNYIKLWKVMRQYLTTEETEVKEAARFAIQTINGFSLVPVIDKLSEDCLPVVPVSVPENHVQGVQQKNEIVESR